MSKRPFVVHERARWGDVDLAAIVRWDAYARFSEIAEAELFREIGFPVTELYGDIWLPRKVARFEYFAPSYLDEMLRIEVYVSRLGATSFTINSDVWGEGRDRMRAALELVLVCVGREDFEKRDLPDELRSALEPWVMDVEVARQSG